MDQARFNTLLTDWKKRAARLEKVLQPLVDREVDFEDPNWEESLETMAHPADESGKRLSIENLFKELIYQFPLIHAQQRQQIVDLMQQHPALMYSAVIDENVALEDGFRKYLILFLIDDQGMDGREAPMALKHYRKTGEQHGFDVPAIFAEMAQLASTRDRHGSGSTRDLILQNLKA